MIMGQDYKFRDDLKKDTVPIEINDGPYKGVVFRYEKIKVHENEGKSAVIAFDYELLETVKHKEGNLRTDETFDQYLGLILNSLLLESVGQKLEG